MRLLGNGILVLIWIIATIYKNDPSQDICSADPNSQVEATIAKCYNATWVYYSFDMCTIPGSSPSSTATPHSGEARRVGAIVGGVLGGVIAVVALMVGALLYLRKKRMSLWATADSKSQDMTSIDTTENNPRHEMAADDTKELPTNPPLEMFGELEGSTPYSVKEDLVELPAEHNKLYAELEAPLSACKE
jgi:hypothetical protein